MIVKAANVHTFERCRLILIALLAAGLFGCAGGGQGLAQASADAELILLNGKIITGESDSVDASAVAISAGRVLAVGDDKEIRQFANAETRVIDLNGKSVIPGIIDSHIHALGYGLHVSKHVMFSTGEQLSVAGMLETIGARASETPPGEWVYVRGPYSLDFVDEGRLPNRVELDRVAPDNPVFINMQGHVGVVNSAAIALSGVTKDTPNPPNGIYVHDPVTNELTGTMYEFPAFTPFLRHIPPYDFNVRLKAARKANEDFTRLGITTVVNLWAEPENLAVLQYLEARDDLPVRWAMVYRLSPEVFEGKTSREIEETFRGFGLFDGNNSDKIMVNGIKIIYDGFAEAAYMRDEYLTDRFGPGWHGVAFWNKQTMQAVMEVCAANNIQVFVHVAGNRAMDDVLDTMEAVDRTYPITGRRWTLEHASAEPTAENIRQVRDMQVIVSTQQAMGWSIGATFKNTWGEELGATFAPNRSWLEALGHPYVKAGSDNRPIDPFIGIWSYVAREDVFGRVGRPDQSISREDALRMYTANGAYGIFAENSLGTLSPGKQADLLVLSDDILDVATDQLRYLKPEMTIVGGKIVYAKSDHP